MRSRVSLAVMLVRHWAAMLAGKSYWHAPQPPGRVFRPGKLEGYFNDMTHKTVWDGPVDDTYGIPVIKSNSGALITFPITAFQKAVGHWDCWLESGRRDTAHSEAFANIVRWALDNQDVNGGWTTWSHLYPDTTFPYSAMSQGEGLSVLTRAYTESPTENLKAAIERAESLILTDLESGGVCWRDSAGLVLEEKPFAEPGSILNGWVYSLFGLYDLAILFPSEERKANLASTVNALATRLERYDTGYWSSYDLLGNLASPFYHDVHVAQLEILDSVFGKQFPVFGAVKNRWRNWSHSRLHRTRATLAKGYQKLRRPPRQFMR